MVNDNVPTQSHLPQYVKDQMEQFIINARLVTSTLGYKVFELPDASGKDGASGDDGLLYYSKSGLTEVYPESPHSLEVEVLLR